MKKYIIILLLFVSAFGHSQVGGFSMLNLDPKTTTERDNVSIAQGLINGSIVLNETTGTLDWYNGSTWVSLGGSGSTYTAGTGLTESPTGTFNVNETYLNGVYLPLDGSQSMEGNLDMDEYSITNGDNGQFRNVQILSNDPDWHISIGKFSADASLEFSSGDAPLGLAYTLRPNGNPLIDTDLVDKAYVDNLIGGSGGTDDQTAAEVTYDNSTSGLTATDVQGAIDELDTNLSPYKFQYENGIGNFQPRLEPSTGNRGQVYYDINSEKLRTYNGTSNNWEDVGNGGGSASLTGYHSINEITSDITAAYSNQVTGSGYRVINEVKGTTDIDVTINNLRSSLVNENYSFVSNSSGSVLELLEGSASFVGKGQEGNNAVRVADYGSANLLEISDGVFRVDGDFEWFTYAQNLILNGTQGSGTGNGATGGTHPGMTNSGTIPTYVIADDGSSAFDFNRYEVTIDLASNGLSVGDTIQIEADAITGGTNPNIYVNINSNSNTEIATINSSNLSDTGVIPSGATELSIWFLPNFNSTNNTTATFTNVSVTKL